MKKMKKTLLTYVPYDKSYLKNALQKPVPFPVVKPTGADKEREFLRFIIVARIAEEFKIKIFDLNGRLVFNKAYSSINGKINVSDLNKLDQAPYLLKIINNETGVSIIKRLIKY